MTITEFLLARIAEDQAEARSSDGLRMPEVPPVGSWGPLRVHVECEAKRRVVEVHREQPFRPGAISKEDPVCRGDGWGMDDENPCDTLCALALPYADHPDYRQEWS